jgi:hypothetical protein
MSSRLTKTRARLTRFGVGSPCIHKKGNIPALITKTLGEKKWLVELLDDETGDTTTTKEVTSQQLRRPKAGDNHPLLQEEDKESNTQNSSTHQVLLRDSISTHQVRLQDSVEGVELSLAQEPQQELENDPEPELENVSVPETQELENNRDREPVIHQMARAAVALLASPFRGRRASSKSSSDGSTFSFEGNYQVPCRSSDDESNGPHGESPATPGVEGPSNLDQEEDISIDGNDQPNGRNENPVPSDLDPDLEMEEELGNFRGEDDLEGTNILAMGQAVEQEDDKYKKKWDRYLVEKKALLDEGFSVKCKPPTAQGIDMGSKVEERSGQRRRGLVVADDRDPTEEGARPCWSVRFDDDEDSPPQRFVPSTQLKVIRDTRVFTWKIVENSSPTDPVAPYKDHGIIGFDFSRFEKAKLDIGNADYDFPFLSLLIHLWPGNWRKQLHNVNHKVDGNNATAAKGKKISLVSENEWWIVWGIIFAACPCHKGGNKLFEKATVRRLAPSVNFGKDGIDVISWHRFKTIKELLCFAFYDHTCPEDPYHPVKLLLDGFNDNRREKVATAIKIVLDESMSPFQPRTTKTSKLPNLSFIFRKPKPLGVENKVSILWLVVAFESSSHLS